MFLAWTILYLTRLDRFFKSSIMLGDKPALTSHLHNKDDTFQSHWLHSDLPVN